MSRFVRIACVVAGCVVAVCGGLMLGDVAAAAETKLNVLFIVADDLRPELGCYGSTTRTPNLDKLAARSVTFDKAYCQQSLCNPSRSSFLTGLRPDATGITCNSLHFREVDPTVTTLPLAFLQSGYVTRDCGKIFHNWHNKEHGDRRSWSAPEFLYFANHGDDKPQIASGMIPPDLATSPKCERRDVDDAAYYDGRVADEAVRVLEEIKGGPFFLAVGFWKPHSPMNAPAKYWDLYERSQFSEEQSAPPVGSPAVALHSSPEILGAGASRVPFTPSQTAEVRHGYWANTAYMDTQVGKVLDALEKSGVADRTIVVFLSDHGYHLGEYGLWGKLTCFELGARVPLMISTPSLQTRGTRADAPVELIDLFPTLAELCGVPAPTGLQGSSLVPMLDDPTAAVKPGAFTQHPRPEYYDRTESGVPEVMGYSVRTPTVRYTEWREWKTGAVEARELYDHTIDPHETKNAIDAPPDKAALDEAVRILHGEFPPNVPPADRHKKPAA